MKKKRDGWGERGGFGWLVVVALIFVFIFFFWVSAFFIMESLEGKEIGNTKPHQNPTS